MRNSIKKILIAHSSNDNYGASKILISVVDILIKNGYDIYLILPKKGPLNNNKTIKRTNLKIINLGVFRKKYFTFLGLINRLYFIIKSSLYIKNLLKKNEIDLVYVNTSTLISPSIASKLAGIPSIYHIHEIPYSSNIYTKFLTKILNNFPKKIITVSNATKLFWSNKGVISKKIIVINNGFQFDFSITKKIDDNKVVFTNISRIIPYKGHLFLIRLFSEILKNRKDLILQIAGDTLPFYDKYLNKLKLKVKEYKIEKNIIFLGHINDIKSILDKSHFFIHTPVFPDPFPTVIFEAIQSKTPVISTDNGGAREILNNFRNGLLIDYSDIEKSSQLILKYINDIDLQKKNVENSQKFITKNFNYEGFSKKINFLISNFE